MARLLQAVLVVLALGGTWAPAAEDDVVKKAIDKGLAALKNLGPSRHHAAGGAALQGLTLLECGLPANDPAVQRRAVEVRQAGIELSHTYSLALAVLFLDRLGEPADSTLIQSMGVRLMAGQNGHGAWTYSCPRAPEAEIRRLTSWLGQRNEQAQLKSSATPRKDGEFPPLPKEIHELMKTIERLPPQNDLLGGLGDHSNTQFAILALWIARRHGLPVEKSLQRAEARFRNSQNGDGGWGYIPVPRGQPGAVSTAPMTCAGLLALGLGIGSVNEAVLRADPKAPAVKLPRDPAKDPTVRSGLLALGTSVGQKPGGDKPTRGPRFVLSKGYYFLWSLERVAVAYGLTTIGNKDWYAWGCDVLLTSQSPDGTWKGEFGPEIDTCFALLFLRKANLAQDLTATLKGRVQDPGEVTLKGGGVGGEGLLAKGLAGLAFGGGEEAITEPPEVTRMRGELVQAPAELQPKLIDRLRETKGAEYTMALASAIPHLNGAVKTRARDALAERLTRMTAATLRDKLQDEDLEIRRAAALACAMKDDKTHAGDLVALLDDTDLTVVRAALASLKSLTTQDLGPDAPPDQRARTIAAWKAWWAKQKK